MEALTNLCPSICLHYTLFRAGHDYNCLFPAMIADWRKKFDSPAMPFYWVVLAPCYGGAWSSVLPCRDT